MSASRGHACVRVVSYALVVACVVLAFTAVAAGAATVPGDFYGVNSGHTLVGDAASRPAAFAAMRAGGLSFVRVDAPWGQIEPAPPTAGVHTYTWATYDPFVADLARNGLRWYPMLGYSAPWSVSVAGDPFSPPAVDADFASFAAALASRYGSGGSFWAEHPELAQLPTTVYGIWNEPSNDHLWHGPDATPARYMSLYVAAQAAIKSVDPGARVAIGGLLDSGFVDAAAYLRAMLDSAPGARDQIDAVGWHPYLGFVDEILASIARARTTLDRYGLEAVPIEISEVGWHTGFAAEQRARSIHDLAMRLPSAGLNVTRLMPYVWAGDPVWQITDPDGSPGPLGGAYFAGIRDASTFPAPTSPSAGATASSTEAKPRTAKACSARRTKARKARSHKSKPRRRPSDAKQATIAKRCRSKVRRKRAKLTKHRPSAAGSRR